MLCASASRFSCVAGSFALACAGSAAAQNWVELVDQTPTRIESLPGVGMSDPDEKDYAWGDLDQDGDLDLVVARKQPFDTVSGRRNVLFMNEGLAQGHSINGVLVDRTSFLATQSDVVGDQGLMALTNDRDVKIADVNGDGWLDVITAAMKYEGQPKHVTHPRIYINLGNDSKGAWQGLRYEDARIPVLAAINPTYGVPYSPNFYNVAVGDVNNDGAVDLYFADAEDFDWFDYNNRLLLNTGTGAFIDVTSTAIPVSAQTNSHAVTSGIADLNLDGANDLVSHGFTVNATLSALYNDSRNPGAFGPAVHVYTGAVADLSIGDLNNDNRPDLVITDDAMDRYLLNVTEIGADQAAFQTFTFPGSSGFGGESVIADLDNDSFPDVLISNVDYCCGGCSAVSHLYRNLGNLPNVTLQEQSPSVIASAELTGVHDFAALDLNGDGWRDVVIGRCAGMRVFMNVPPCAANVAGDGSPGGMGTVDVQDLLAIINAWGSVGGPNDVNQNGTVDVGDLLAVINAWGACQ